MQPTFEDHTTTGEPIYYEKEGSGDPIVFINGFGLTNRMWRKQVEHLKDSYSCITYDIRGFGKSPVPKGPYSHHEDLLNLMKSLNITNAHIVGLSLGGYISIDFALTYPEFVKSLTLLSSTLGGYPRKVQYSLEAEKGTETAKRNWLNHELFSPARKKEQVFSEIQDIVSEYSGWHWINQDPALKIEPPAVTRLSQIQIPTQIITGENDLEYYNEVAGVLESGIRNSTRIIVQDAGHMVNMEQPERTNYLIENFISSLA